MERVRSRHGVAACLEHSANDIVLLQSLVRCILVVGHPEDLLGLGLGQESFRCAADHLQNGFPILLPDKAGNIAPTPINGFLSGLTINLYEIKVILQITSGSRIESRLHEVVHIFLIVVSDTNKSYAGVSLLEEIGMVVRFY